MTFIAVALLAGAAWTLGRLALARFEWLDLRPYERLGLEMTAGLGLVALSLALLALAGLFFLAAPMLLVLALAQLALGRRVGPGGFAGAAGWVGQAGPAGFADPVGGPGRAPAHDPPWVRRVTLAIFICAGIACVGAITPVTDYDGLSYVVPIASRIADTGRLHVWTDQARSMWPLSHELLLAFVLRLGGTRLIAVTALEWLVALCAVSAFARRACLDSTHVPVAVVLAVAAPVVAFQISTVKEDLLLVAATAAVGFCLVQSAAKNTEIGELTLSRRSLRAPRLWHGDLAAAGLFAGVAAATKYPGLGVAIAAATWVLLTSVGRRLRATLIVAGGAMAVGGLWYGLNLWRFGNPVAPFVFGVPGTPLDVATVRALFDGWGLEKNAPNFLVTPVRLFLDPATYLGRAALFNPLVYLALAGLGVTSIRRRSAPLFFMAAVLYVGWFFSLENARLLLPAAVLLAPAAADVLVALVRRWRPVAWVTAAGLAVPMLLIPVVGITRVIRYARDPTAFLYNYTERYADIQWINTHLDPRVHRIGSFFPDVGYLTIPFISFAPTYQMELTLAEVSDPARLLEACRRQRITHLFAAPLAFPAALLPQLRVVYDNPSSRRGGEHFFRQPGTEHVTLFEIIP